jgi:MFS superfamily sulfate permease-like transporter
MRLQDARELYYTYTGKTSDLVRQLGLGGIAIIWVFKYETLATPKIPHELITPLLLIVVGLAFDLLQYGIAASIYGVFQRQKELAKVPEDADFKVPRYFNWPAITCFIIKCLAIIIAYIFLFKYLACKII